MTQFLWTLLLLFSFVAVSSLLGYLTRVAIVSYFKIEMIPRNYSNVMGAQFIASIIVYFGLIYLAEFEQPTTGIIGGTVGIFLLVRSWILEELGMGRWEIDYVEDEEEVKEKVDQKAKEENQLWKPTFKQIILLVNKYGDKGASASYTEENTLEVKAGNPPEYLIKVYIYDHPSSGIVLRSRFSRLDGGAVVMSGDEGIPMLTKDYETPEEAEETLFGLIDLLFEEGFVHFSLQN